ncbi:DinB family protein [Ferruginibacter sp. HRS2-29]|uniref:DinB family protein n=1 Tax=Ferruginibacter sp. HRS2-29 TaxID=2487334 RepID=UPI0020CE9A1A|nr:DinB family protein [Ferruginibacter sp. HRS2-29]MCP9751159.1 DinB family protein [Ferruginibacter sp. HRS2-29]
MKIKIDRLTKELNLLLEKAIADAKTLKGFSEKELNQRASDTSWSALECIQHLNLYGDFYLPEIEKTIELKRYPAVYMEEFKTGWLGNYFANLMKASSGNIKKMKSPKDKNPIHSSLNITTIDRFIKQLEKMQALLLQAKKVDLAKTRIPTSLSAMIKLKLGDTFRFLIYHIERHMLQAMKAIE